jgi:hypothetical protein
MPQPTRMEIRRFRRDRAKLERLRDEIAQLQLIVDQAEDRLLEWIEDQGIGDTVEIHGQKITVQPGAPGRVDWQREYRDYWGDEAADSLIRRVEVHKQARIAFDDDQPPPPIE